jgi:hypothetical protein
MMQLVEVHVDFLFEGQSAKVGDLVMIGTKKNEKDELEIVEVVAR